MSVGVVNHDNCILHVAELRLLPGLNELRPSDAERLFEHPTFGEWLNKGRVEVLRKRGTIRSPDPSQEGDQRNFAMEEVGGIAQSLRKKSLLENPDQIQAQFAGLQGRGMSPSQAIAYIASAFGLETSEVAARLDA